MINTLNTRASIIIPSYNRSELLPNTVKFLLQQITDRDEIIIVDQTDIPSTAVRKLSSSDKRIIYLHITEKGLPNARNVGARTAKGEIIIFCDDDVIPEKGFVEAHVKAYKDTNVGAVAGRVILQGKESSLEPTKFGTIRAIDYKITGNFQSLKRRFVEHGHGCNISIRKRLVEQGVYSDIRFGGTAHLEETDLLLQIRDKGHKILYEPDAALIHLIEKQGGCRAPDMEKWLYWYGHNYMLLFLKHGSMRYFPFFFLARIAKLLLSSIQLKNPKIFLKGFSGMIDGFVTYKNLKIIGEAL